MPQERTETALGDANDEKTGQPMGGDYDAPESKILSAHEIRTAHYDRKPWNGQLHDELRLELALRVLTSIRDEQPGANACVRGLCEATLEVIG